ncbi:hypothetical protein F5148DRAFT_972824 [Russula earlei]|uniref:Uncharacterized protein n=1 Tax=Russula earlei TaxID=71964 RepID=A0ACC0UNA4_9AGAM|nr:hypothetical protein F5148DRAFT_972824 [Russula earlei]
MSAHPSNSNSLYTPPDILVSAMQNIALSPSVDTEAVSPDNSPAPLRPFVSYTQAQILFLSKSQLVSPPHGMPPLRDWFGDWNEQNTSKKDSDTSAASSGTRDKRFRRDQEDAGTLPPRATFRSTSSQPSQMGNFKHQPIRSSEREKDKDTDRERERDLRDKEGQERLRSLSDKYDRDRLSSPAGAANLRTRERDSAPHLGGTGRLPSQGSLGSGATRRADGRDPSRRKAGESSEDWRRGKLQPSCPVGSDGLRREREDRERPRSRIRDSSRQRRDASPARRERELDRDRDEHHRKRDGRDRDIDRDTNDDPRRWRDDGKRDERMAARRELRDKEYREREREREKERNSRVNERDSRSKRTNGRDRRGHSRDEDRDERKDSRVRVEEKEPAWMDTYIPSESGVGILGGKADNGELDGIQAWKLGMKEKERLERESEMLRSSGDTEHGGSAKVNETQAVPPSESPLDEIQLIKLMIKREEEKNKATSLKGPANDPAVAYLVPGTDSGVSQVPPASGFAPSPSVDASASPTAPSTKPTTPSVESPKPPGSRFFPNPSTAENAPIQGQQDRLPASASAIRSPMPSQFNPPPGSRLLAFGSRTPSATAGVPLEQPSAFTISGPTLDTPPPLSHPVNGPHQFLDIDTSNFSPTARVSVATGLPPAGFSTLTNPTRLPVFPSDGGSSTQSEILRRQSLASFGDRMAYGATSDLTPYPEIGSPNALGPQSSTPNSQSPSFDSSSRERGLGGSPFPQQKGSRFAKFFDGKSREQPVPTSADGSGSFPHPLLPYQRQQGIGGGESYTQSAENRTMEDIFTMLQNSTQVSQRLSQTAPPAQPSGYGQSPFVQQHANISTRQPQLAHMGRNHDMLYENRLDDRNFVPDGMVPGLRSTFPSRRESGLFQDPLDDLGAFNVQQRIPPQRAVEQIYLAPLPSVYPSQTNVPRNSGLTVQQSFRNGNSPNAAHAAHLHSTPQQRIPPGLANLGGRPPHDPSQFLGSIVGMPSPHLQGSGSGQAAYNFSSGNVSYPTGPQVRVAPAVSPNIQNNIDHSHGVSLLHATKLDVRAPPPAQLLGLNGSTGGAGPRAPGVGFAQQNALPMHIPHATMRQQPHIQQQPQPQTLSHLLPQHMQASTGTSSQPAQDLMAILMHGAPRD